MPLSLSSLGWWWMFDPAFSAINWVLMQFGFEKVPWLGDIFWARVATIQTNIWFGTPFFMIMYLAGLQTIPQELYEASEIDGASILQRFTNITLPLLKNIISITVMFSTIVTFSNFDIVRIMTHGGPQYGTHLFGTYAYNIGIETGHVPKGAAVSLFMFPVLAIAAFIILRMVRRREV
jgi:multiple sugar transport system permease protein